MSPAVNIVLDFDCIMFQNIATLGNMSLSRVFHCCLSGSMSSFYIFDLQSEMFQSIADEARWLVPEQ